MDTPLKTICDRGPTGKPFPIPTRHMTKMFVACADCRPMLASIAGASIGTNECQDNLHIISKAILLRQCCVVHVVSTIWSARVLEGDAPAEFAYRVAESQPHILRHLQSVSSYMILAERDISPNKPNQEPILFRIHRNPAFSDHQKKLLTSGHRALEAIWKDVSAHPPRLARHTPECDENRCSMIWAKRWEAAGCNAETLKYSSVDVLGRLRCMHGLLKRGIVDNLGFFSCQTPAFSALEAVISSVENSLVPIFPGRV